MKILNLFLVSSIVLAVGYVVITQKASPEPKIQMKETSEYNIVCSGRPWNFAESTVLVGQEEIPVAVARSSQERQAGLGGCSHIPPQAGMYFMFNSSVQISFWMKGMVIPIDMIWIADGVVIHVTENVPPQVGVADEDLERYSPGQAASAVLEVAAGEAARRGIAVGDAVDVQ